MNGRRSDLEIAAEILKLAKNGARQTTIMYGCNLNHGRVRGYLATLQVKGLIECSQRGQHTEYVTTDRGTYFLQHLEIAVATLENGPGATHPGGSDRSLPLPAFSALGQSLSPR